MAVFSIKIVCSLVYIFIGIAAAAPPSKLPKNFMQCKLSDPDISECIKNGLQSAVPHLAKGIPSLGLLPNDPLRISALEIDQGVGAVQLKLKFKDLDILNMKSSIIKELKYNPTNHSMKIMIAVQKPIVLEGLYETNGKVLILPVTGNGTCKITLDNYASTSFVQLKPVDKNGKKHLEIQKLTWKFSTSKMQMKMNNLFNGDKVLGENMNVFLNENWRDLLTEMQPAFEETLGAAFIAIGQEFFNRIPMDEIFLD